MLSQFSRFLTGIEIHPAAKIGKNLTNDNAIKLLANTLATGAGLFVLITAFADISGAHFNPFVSLVMFLRKKIKGNLLKYYISAQLFGCQQGIPHGGDGALEC